MNWYDIKRAALQRMFALEGNEIVRNNSNARYLAGMPAAANEGLRLISGAGRGIVKCCTLLHNPPQNLLDTKQDGIPGAYSKKAEFLCRDAQLFCFDIQGSAELELALFREIPQDIPDENPKTNLPVHTENHSFPASGNGSAVSKALFVPNSRGFFLRARFSSEGRFCLANLAMYKDDIAQGMPDTSTLGEARYNLLRIAPDYDRLLPAELLLETPAGPKNPSFRLEGGCTLVLPMAATGLYRIWYSAKPPEITTSTEDDFQPGLSHGQEELLPLYMASQLYKDDDFALATAYRNEFEAGLARLAFAPVLPMREEFESRWLP